MSQKEDFSHDDLTVIGQTIRFYLEEELGDQRHRELLGRVEAAAQRKLPGDHFETEARRIASRVLQGDDETVLDGVIHDDCCAVASGINNDGAEAQVKFLLSKGWSEAEILKVAGVDLAPAATAQG
ncbi:hypothetical protein A9R05_44720 (plasmid) [Burkholderia sp. KK1]|uniref:Uncharacterized protein n=1 Tax=Burkholderia sp. M701 TaxID=326454 RepID=V5YQU2_9BURK|nr:hypothetical protein [Burkholderia sp. M701]AQH06044.1 hypothetical protein A9R05_44720 [Burkholderia sp. KK1]BAO19291.1 hypothetical protein [Burkholderia sp. M701]